MSSIDISQKNTFDLQGIIPQDGKYVAVKICSNVDLTSYSCGTDSDSLTDALYINGKSTGYGLGNSSKAAYKLTQGRKFFKIY